MAKAAVGRKKRRKMRRLAILVECDEEFCGSCEMVEVRRDDVRKYHYLYCKWFKKELSPAFNDSIAERCAACHLAERCGAGEDTREDAIL